MRVLIFSLAYYPVVGGAEVAVKEITDRLSDIEFDMVTMRFSKSNPIAERLGNVTIHRIDSSKVLFPWKAYRYAKKLHKERPYDAAWSIMAAYAGFAALFFKKKFSHIPLLLTLQEGDPLEYIEKKVRFVYPIWEQIFARADKAQAISNFLANWANEKGYKGKVEVIPNGVDTSIFLRGYPRSELDTLKSSLDIKDADKCLITTSRLVAKNAVGDVIESLKYLPHNIKFLILGTGPLEDELKQKAALLGVADRVMFLGFVEHSEMPKYLKISDIFIRPSLSEGMGNSFIEAFAAGIPVIATSVGGIPDFLFDPDKDHDMPPTGLFVEVKSPRLIAFQVQRLISDKVLRDKLTINAKRLALEKYDWNLIVEEMRRRVFCALE